MEKSYNDALNLLTSAGKFRISLGLERISRILDLLGNPQDSLKCIHVAGTNGKGSVCAILSSILSAAGIKTGLFTSPHIFKYNERIKICGNDISDDDFTRYVFDIVNLSEKHNIDLTEFEILTAVMFKYFADNNVDIAILETGLGGRFDATNVIKSHLCSVITHVDLDHTERLGKTISEIAFEKAGIMKSGCPCIVFEGLEVYKDAADSIGAMLMVILPFANTDSLCLKGVFQQENLALALAVIETVFPDISPDIIDKGLRNVKHPCRFQYIAEKNTVVDGAHNPNGIAALVQSLEMCYPNAKKRFIFGCLNNKDYPKMLNILFSSYGNQDVEVYFYHFNHKNSCTFEQLQEVSPVKAKELTPDTKPDFNDGRLNIICGSLYMIADIARRFNLDILS